MAIIDNHKDVKIDKTFTDKHPEMFAFFDAKGIDVEVSDDFESFQIFLEGLSKEEYPYGYDVSFSDQHGGHGFNLTLKKDNNIIATYAAKLKEVVHTQSDYAEHFDCAGDSINKSLPAFRGSQMYSSCQWVSIAERGNKLGVILDHLKKNICFDIFGADMQYATHKKPLKDYHIDKLHYSNSDHLVTLENSEIYNIAWIAKEDWAAKLNDVKKLYTI